MIFILVAPTFFCAHNSVHTELLSNEASTGYYRIVFTDTGSRCAYYCLIKSSKKLLAILVARRGTLTTILKKFEVQVYIALYVATKCGKFNRYHHGTV